MRKMVKLITVFLTAAILLMATSAMAVSIRAGKPSIVAQSYGVASNKSAYAGTGGGGSAKINLPNGKTYEYATNAASVFNSDGRPVTVNTTQRSPSGKVIVDGPGKPGGGGGGGTGGGSGGGSTTPVGTGGGGTGGGSGGSTYNTGSYESYYTTYTVSYSYTPPAYADLYIASIAPVTEYRYGAEVITTVTVGNDDIKFASGAVVEFTVNGITQTETVNVASGGRAQVVFKWKVPESATSITLKAEVNRGRTVEESDYSNNTLSKDATVTQPVVVTTRELFDDADKRWAKTPNVAPLSPNNSRLEWQENGVNYHAELTTTVTKTMVPAEKSGYGFELVVAPVVTTNYPNAEYVLHPQQVVLWLPEFGYQNGVELERHDQNSDLWQLPKSPYKPLGNRRWYVPVWWPDGPYKAVVSVYGTYCPAGELTTTSLVDFNIQGSMFDDIQTVNTPY